MRQRGDRVGQRFREQQPDRRVELVDRADRLDPRRILGHPRAVAQAGRAGVAGTGNDFRESVAHGRWPFGRGAAYEKRRWGARAGAPEARRGPATTARPLRRRLPDGSGARSCISGCRERSIIVPAPDREPRGRAFAPTRHDAPESLRTRPRSQPRQLHAAVAPVADRAHRLHLSATSRGGPRRAAIHVGGDLRAEPPAGLGARAGRHRRGRHGRIDGGQHAGNVRGALRRADDRRGAQHAQHAARRGGACLHAASTARPRC